MDEDDTNVSWAVRIDTIHIGGWSTAHGALYDRLRDTTVWRSAQEARWAQERWIPSLKARLVPVATTFFGLHPLVP